MPNRNYVKGRNKEYKIIKNLKPTCEITARTAGSHSPIDVFAIDKINKKILFIQSKPDNYSVTNTEKLETDLAWLNGFFEVKFIVM